MKELTWPERGRLWLRLGLRLVLTVLVLVFLFALGKPLLSLFGPFVLAFLAAWLLNPAVRFFQKKCKMPRKLTSIVLILLCFAALGGLLWGLMYNAVGEIVSLAENWDALMGSLQRTLDQFGVLWADFSARLPASVNSSVDTMIQELLDWLRTVIPAFLQGTLTWVRDVAAGVPSFAVASITFIMASYFLSADYPRLRYFLDNSLPEGPRFFILAVRRAMSAGFGGYFKAELILSIGVFFILLAGFFVTGEPYGLLLAFLLAALDFIPILGSGTAMIPWAIVDLLTKNYRHALGLMIIWGIVALFRRLGEPRVLGQQTGLSPILSLASVYVGMRLGGVMGMILGPVLCLVVLNIGRSGILDNVKRDLYLAGQDISAILRPVPDGSEQTETDTSESKDAQKSSKNN